MFLEDDCMPVFCSPPDMPELFCKPAIELLICCCINCCACVVEFGFWSAFGVCVRLGAEPGR